MSTLTVRWSEGQASFEPGTTVRIGRDLDAEIQPANANVSRQHAEVVHRGTGWVLRDVGSGQGTWRDGQKIETLDIRGTIQVTLGREGRGEFLTLEAAVSAPLVPARAAATQIVGAHHADTGGGPPASHDTIVVGAVSPNRPGGALRAEAISAATVVSGDAINLECGGRSYSFRPGKDVVIGRDDDCDVVSTNPNVSRHHAALRHDGSGWLLIDDASTGGTFIDGERTREYRLAGSIAAFLGDPVAGERLVVVASGQRPPRPAAATSRSRTIAIAIAIAGAVAVGALAWFTIGRPGGSPTNDQLARATVRLVAGEFTGTGTIVDSEQGLILTNAHVVAPDAPGTGVREVLPGDLLDPTPRSVDVLVAPGLDKAAEPRFRAEVVAVDGYLDLAVLRITTTTAGRIVEAGGDELAGLVEVALGDSAAMATGDEIRVFGYPVAAQSSSVTVTEGVVSGPVQDERIGANGAMLNISANISPGNSGGLAVDVQGRLVGVPTLVRDQEVSSMRPSEFAEALVAAARDGETYVSPWIRPLAGEQIDNVALVAPDGSVGTRFSCSSGELTSVEAGAVGVTFDYSGFSPGEHQDLMVVIRAGDDVVGLWTLADEHPVSWPSPSGCATVTVPIDTSAMTDGAQPLSLFVGLGPNYLPMS
jgi:pSer/pThr/pTyr-binding forkhead associated (FHA) protein/S1-C subfamily serine protease